MPLCHLSLRPLLHSRALQPFQRPSIHRAPCRGVCADLHSASATLRHHLQGDDVSNSGLDLSKVSADSAYLDFILGPAEHTTKTLDDKIRESNAGNAAGKSILKSQSSSNRQEKGVMVLQTSRAKSNPKSTRRIRTQTRKIPVHIFTAHNRKSRATLKANLDFHRLQSQGVRLQSKFVSLKSGGSSKDFFSRHWNVNFARIQNAFDNAEHHSGVMKRTAPNLIPQVKEWVELVQDHLSRPGSVRVGQLLHRDHKRAISRWQSVALWLLYNDPECMLEFLKASNAAPYPPLSCLEDSLQYLAKHFAHAGGSRNTAAWQELYDLFTSVAHERTDKRLWIQSSFFRLLMQHCTDRQVQEMYRTIKTRHVRVSWHTYLHFATYFAKHEHFEQSLDAILEAKDVGAALDSYAFRSNCATLLRTAIRQPGGLRVTMRIVSNLVKIGLPLNTRLCNIVMLNAVEAGDLKTAFSVYNSLVENGVKADAYTHTILLKGCRGNIDDAETLNTTIRSAIEGVDVTRNIVLATEILHCLALHHTKHSAEKSYDTVLDAYAQLFDLQPLRVLGLPLPRSYQSHGLAPEKLQPNEYALNIMIATYLDHYFVQNHSTSPIHEIYQRLRTLTKAGEEPFNLLARTDYNANVFLKSFTRTRKGLLHAAEVIKDMQVALPASAKVRQCPPTVQSWSIFLHGFTRHKQLQLAEQVLSFIQAQGLQPNHITWTSLIAGYASMQDLDRVLDTVRRGETDGAVWDEWTMGGLRRLIDQRKLQEECRNQRLAASLDFTRDIRDGLEPRLLSASADVNVGRQ